MTNKELLLKQIATTRAITKHCPTENSVNPSLIDFEGVKRTAGHLPEAKLESIWSAEQAALIKIRKDCYNG